MEHQQALAVFVLAEIEEGGQLHVFSALCGVGKARDGHIHLALRDGRLQRAKLHGHDDQLYAQTLGDVLGQLNVRADVLIVARGVGIDEFAGSKVGRGGEGDFADGEDLFQLVFGQRCAGQAEDKSEGQQQSNQLFHFVFLLNNYFGNMHYYTLMAAFVNIFMKIYSVFCMYIYSGANSARSCIPRGFAV